MPSEKPLYFLIHKDNPQMFSGYGVPISESKYPLVGMLMVDRPARCPDNYLQDLKEAFGEVIIGPMTLKGDKFFHPYCKRRNTMDRPFTYMKEKYNGSI